MWTGHVVPKCCRKGGRLGCDFKRQRILKKSWQKKWSGHGRTAAYGPASVVKVPRDAGEQRSCTSDYWQAAFRHLRVCENAQERPLRVRVYISDTCLVTSQYLPVTYRNAADIRRITDQPHAADHAHRPPLHGFAAVM